jgi:hypothetical protein
MCRAPLPVALECVAMVFSKRATWLHVCNMKATFMIIHRMTYRPTFWSTRDFLFE